MRRKRGQPPVTRIESLAAWAAGREVVPLAAAVALVTLSARWAALGLALLLLTWFVRWLGRGRPTVRTPVDLPVLLLLLTVPVTFYATTDRGTTAIQVARLLAGVGLVYGLANWARQEAHLSLLALGLPAVGLGLALFGLIAVSWPSAGKLPFIPAALYGRTRALVQDAVNANVMAGALVVLLPFPVAGLLAGLGSGKARGESGLPPVAGTVPRWVARALDDPWLRRLWFAAAAAAMVAVLVLTKSRGGWLAAAAALFVLLAGRWRWAWALLPLAALGVGLLAWRLGPAALLDALSTGGGALSGWDSRVEIWSRAIYMIQDFPFTGVGAGTFGRVADILYPFFLIGPDAQIPHAHNLFLQVAVDLGIPGLVAFLAILLLAAWCGVSSARAYRRVGQGGLSLLAWAGLAGLAGMIVHGMVDATTWVVGRGAFVPWVVIGLLVAMAVVWREGG
jgi:putative inorganic carbon (HCO3(-)) transporter